MSESRFISFRARVGGIDPGWDVVNKRSGDIIGIIEWYARWRRLVLEGGDAVFDAECLRDIATFMEEETRKRKASK